MKTLATIQDIPVIQNPDGSVEWISGMAVDNDGPNGNPEGDPDHQETTSLKVDGKSVDSEKVPGVVISGALIRLISPPWLGSKCEVTYKNTTVDAVAYDFGPSHKIGEGSVALAKRLGIPASPNSGGVSTGVHFKIFPGIPAVVDGITYPLQHA